MTFQYVLDPNIPIFLAGKLNIDNQKAILALRERGGRLSTCYAAISIHYNYGY